MLELEFNPFILKRPGVFTECSFGSCDLTLTGNTNGRTGGCTIFVLLLFGDAFVTVVRFERIFEIFSKELGEPVIELADDFRAETRDEFFSPRDVEGFEELGAACWRLAAPAVLAVDDTASDELESGTII